MAAFPCLQMVQTELRTYQAIGRGWCVLVNKAAYHFCRVAGEHQDRHAGGDAAAGGAGQSAVLSAASPDAAQEGEASACSCYFVVEMGGFPVSCSAEAHVKLTMDTVRTLKAAAVGTVRCLLTYLLRPFPIVMFTTFPLRTPAAPKAKRRAETTGKADEAAAAATAGRAGAAREPRCPGWLRWNWIRCHRRCLKCNLQRLLPKASVPLLAATRVYIAAPAPAPARRDTEGLPQGVSDVSVPSHCRGAGAAEEVIVHVPGAQGCDSRGHTSQVAGPRVSLEGACTLALLFMNHTHQFMPINSVDGQRRQM
jgi:hypothetical protein